MSRHAPLAISLLAAALLSACGSGGSTEASTGQGGRSTQGEDLGRLRDAVVRGVAENFRGGTDAGPRRFGLCLRLGVRRALTVGELNRLVSIHRRPDGQAFAAQALNELAAPIGGVCGGAKFVPELVAAAGALGGRYPLGRLDRQARRIGIVYGPHLGVTCRDASTTRCDDVGIDLVLGSDATAVTATVGGRRLELRTPGLHNGVARRDWVGYLHGVGLERPRSPFFTGRKGRVPRHWAGNPAVYLPVRLAVKYPDAGHGSASLRRVLLSPGWG
jgi:hypothetical protein